MLKDIHPADRLRMRMDEGARRYAAADKSDPFAYARARTHMKNGIAGLAQNGGDAFYDATEDTETRKLPNGPDGKEGAEYQAVVYRSRVRP
jgi:hypothetical protein